MRRVRELLCRVDVLAMVLAGSASVIPSRQFETLWLDLSRVVTLPFFVTLCRRSRSCSFSCVNSIMVLLTIFIPWDSMAVGL